jgi:hypothetical protein
MEVFIMFENNDYIYMTRKEYNIWINNMYFIQIHKLL